MTNREAIPYKVIPVETVGERQSFTETWHTTWLEEAYTNVNEDIIKKYGQYDAHSTDYLLVNRTDEAVGTLRIIQNNGSIGLPVLNDFSIRNELTNEKLCEATLLTVKKEFRHLDNLCAYLLLIELWKFARTNAIDGIAIAADIRLWYLLTRKLNLCFSEIGERKIYEGSMTVPGYLSVREQKERSLNIVPKNIFEQALKDM